MTAEQKIAESIRYWITGVAALIAFGYLMYYGAFIFAAAALIICFICNGAARKALDESKRLSGGDDD